MTFQVVTFLKSTKEVEIVPALWTFSENGVLYTYWPRLRNIESIRAAAKEEDTPNKSKWGKYAVRVLHTFESYDEAETHLAHFFNNSDFGSVSLDCPSAPASSSQNKSRSVSSSPESVPSKFQLCLPPLPSTNRPVAMENPKSRPVTERYNAPCETDNFEMQRYLDKKLKDLEVTLGRKLVELESQQQDMMAVLEELKGSMQTAPIQVTTVPNWRDHGLPFTVYEALLDFDEQLESNSKLRQDLVSWLSRSGGNSLAEVVNSIMMKIMTDAVALNLTFFGTSTKSAFKSLNLKDVVYEAVVSVLADTTEKQCRLKVQSYLDHANDRMKAKETAELKKKKKPSARKFNSFEST